MNKLLQSSALIWGLSLTGASYAQTIENVTITGPYDIWESDGAGNLTKGAPPPDPPPLDNILEGDASSPGSNVELANFDDGNAAEFNDNDVADNTNWANGVITTLSGEIGELEIEGRSLTPNDWQADSYALARNYVNAALASIGKTSADWVGGPCGTFDAAVTAFVEGPPGPPTGAQRVSDPNIGYIGLDGNALKIGLQGQLDVTTAGIGALFPCVGYDPQVDPSPPQASEVVALTISRGDVVIVDDEYAYSFEATATNQETTAGSYDGNYEITIPVPGPTGPPTTVPAASAMSLAGATAGLLAIGLAGLRRRRPM